MPERVYDFDWKARQGSGQPIGEQHSCRKGERGWYLFYRGLVISGGSAKAG